MEMAAKPVGANEKTPAKSGALMQNWCVSVKAEATHDCMERPEAFADT